VALTMRKPSLWQVIIGLKILLLIGLWLAMDSGFTLGDQDLFAEDKGAKDGGKEAKDTKEAKESKEKVAEKADQEKKTIAPKGSDEAKVDSEKSGGKARKSFLANLLELPELHPETMKKDELGKYLEVAERKKQQIEDRLAGLSRREEQLKGLEGSIDEKLKRLDEERRYFAQTIQQEKDLKGERLDKLITMYAKMEPKKAAPVLEKMDKDLVVELFKALPQKQVTAILEVMTPDKSVLISEYYGRVRSTREYDVLKEMNQSLRKEFDDCKGMGKS